MAPINDLLRVIPLGKQNAIHAEDIARLLNLPTGGNQVEARGLIREAILQGNIILSIPKVGYWRSNSKTEVETYITSLNERAQEINERSIAIKQAWNSANPQNVIL
ncbi:hypothetical protein [uncultured Rikenella sp.]|uniref:hypothetical protein n=1 Tax=uncultured Rikenella sp. TaxID=368003 RepID=UPI0026015CDD|nr:hypothetical protein [uncultured Rikenella sp.]